MVQQLRNRRFETRLDSTTDGLIAQAASQLGESRSTFVVRAAKEEAERVLADPPTITKAEALAILLEGVDETALSACPLLKGLRTPS
ncbi:MAG: DUF1778 domain-containing protein [Propionibacteriaceae bacterium]|jgi:uncharacterized protein (DUF1778 family)|nr:DUF1778 domain-containing protein [Propionibacteriaceae bacterium]